MDFPFPGFLRSGNGPEFGENGPWWFTFYGHWIPEEQPGFVIEQLARFFKQ
jgi:hypothetical protein